MKDFVVYDVNSLTNAFNEKLRAFLKHCWRETYFQQLGSDITKRMIDSLDDNNLGGMLSAEDVSVLVCMDDDEILGTCMYASRYGITYIWGVYVHPSQQASGIGKGMLSTLVKKNIFKNILQVIVLEVSTGAIEFYKHLGFSITQKIVYELIEGCNQPAFIMTVSSDSLSEIGHPL